MAALLRASQILEVRRLADVAPRLKVFSGSAVGPDANDQTVNLWPDRCLRAFGIAVGVCTHLLFGVTVWHLFYFLRDGVGTASDSAVLIDAFLSFQFAVIHSLLLWPPVRERLTPWIGSSFYGCFFCVVTCLTLLLAISEWRSSSVLVWNLHGAAKVAMQCGFFGSWGSLFYSLWLSGLGYQTGWTPWWHWFKRRPLPRREFRPRSLYRLLRHPVYLSFLGLIWFTPRMSLDHAVLTGIWSVYIFFGSYLKDERLAYYLQQTYREYQSRVPGYPLFPLAFLGRRPLPENDRETVAVSMKQQATTGRESSAQKAA